MLKLLFVVLWFSLAFSGALWLSLAVSLALRLSPVLFWFLWLSICILWASPACSAVSGVLWTSLATELGWAKNLNGRLSLPYKKSRFLLMKKHYFWVNRLGGTLRARGLKLKPACSSWNFEATGERIYWKTSGKAKVFVKLKFLGWGLGAKMLKNLRKSIGFWEV